MINMFFYSAFAFIAVASLLLFLYAYRRDGKFFNIATFFLFSGTIFLVLMLLFSGIEKQQHPATSTFESYNFLALLLLIIYFIAEFKFKIRMLGTFFPPLALFLMVISALIPSSTFAVGKVTSVAVLSVHIALSLLGEAFFALSFITSLLFLIQERNLKQKRFKGMFFRLPSIARIEKASSFSLLFGYPFLTSGLLLGFVMAGSKFGGKWYLDVKIVFTMLVWIVYSVVFILKVSKRLQGKRFAMSLVAAFILVIICYALANYFSDFHNFIYSSGAGS